MNITFRNFSRYLNFWLLPLLGAVFPAVFHYGNNAGILSLSSLIRMLILNTLLSIVVFLFLLIFIRRPVETANAALVFLIFFNTYGVAYDSFLKADLFQVEHFALLPLDLLLAGYACWLVSKMKLEQSIQLWNSLMFIVAALVIFNVVRIIPAELEKRASAVAAAPLTVSTGIAGQKYPDIYFIILDEFSGFEPMRAYWHNPKVDVFVHALQARGFFIAEQSHSSSITSLHQMAERLNYQEFPCCSRGNHPLYFRAIDHNKVMSYLKARGYSTVTMEELSGPIGFTAMPPIGSDFTFKNPSKGGAVSALAALDEFGILLADDSMLRAFSQLYQSNSSSIETHKEMLFYAMDKVANLGEVPTPKFIYVHLLFPHRPFLYNAKGDEISIKNNGNWAYYLGQYNYSMDLTLKMIDGILSDADPDRPPVIILQSDHGARNIESSPTTVILKDFPEEYKTNIMFALHLPGYDTSAIPQDVKPINTFPIVFNYLFDDHIPLK